jgi:two-component system chemotaxis response regulator CheB
MNARDIIVIGASAGGVSALRQLVKLLPHDFLAAVFVVRHFGAYAESVLPEILERAGPLKATDALDGERFSRGRIHCAPPNLILK